VVVAPGREGVVRAAFANSGQALDLSIRDATDAGERDPWGGGEIRVLLLQPLVGLEHPLAQKALRLYGEMEEFGDRVRPKIASIGDLRGDGALHRLGRRDRST